MFQFRHFLFLNATLIFISSFSYLHQKHWEVTNLLFKVLMFNTQESSLKNISEKNSVSSPASHGCSR